MSDWFYYKWTLRSYTACQTRGEIDKVSWYSFCWWISVVTMESSLWSKFLLTSWVFVSGQVEYECHWQYCGSKRKKNFCLGWCWPRTTSPLLRTESNWPLVMTTFLIIMGLAEAPVTVQSPSLPKRWQHWVTEDDLATSTPVARWLSRTGSRWLLTRCCWSWDSSIHILTNELRAQEWRRDAERNGEIDQWEAK